MKTGTLLVLYALIAGTLALPFAHSAPAKDQTRLEQTQ